MSPGNGVDAARPLRLFLLKYFDTEASRDPTARWQLPYALDSITAAGVSLHVSDADLRAPWTSPRRRRIVRRLERAGAPFLATLLGTGEIARADAVLAIFESQGFVLALLRALRVPPYTRPRYCIVSCWLAMDVPTFGWFRRFAYRFAYRGVDRLVYFSRNQTDTYRTMLGMPEERLAFVPFGVDHEQWAPVDADDDGTVLAVGRDRGRDWPTLFDAVRGSDLRVRLACRPEDIAGLDVPTNVERLGLVSRDEYRDLTARASVVVVPTEVRPYPTGQSVTLESMSMGKCCVVTDTPAMSDYLIGGVNALLIPPHDPIALRNSLERAVCDPELRARIGAAARRSVLERFTAEEMWRRVATMLAGRCP
jgi:glycosyltransferase involved in cell wall biosynthesis